MANEEVGPIDLWHLPVRFVALTPIDTLTDGEHRLRYRERLDGLVLQARRAPDEVRVNVVVDLVVMWLAEPGAWLDAAYACRRLDTVELSWHQFRPDVWQLHLGVAIDALVELDGTFNLERARAARSAMARRQPDEEKFIVPTVAEIPLPCHPDERATMIVDPDLERQTYDVICRRCGATSRFERRTTRYPDPPRTTTMESEFRVVPVPPKEDAR